MFRPLEVFIGLRYTRAKRRNHFISFISLVSILGIAVGVTALITVISVMNGFDKELKDRILGMVSHATISGVGETVRDWPVALESRQGKSARARRGAVRRARGDAAGLAQRRRDDPRRRAGSSSRRFRKSTDA